MLKEAMIQYSTNLCPLARPSCLGSRTLQSITLACSRGGAFSSDHRDSSNESRKDGRKDSHFKPGSVLKRRLDLSMYGKDNGDMKKEN
jgi:hypothetical protein